MADVFISYAREDRPQAAKLASKLEAAGYSVWWDYDLVGGARYRKAILSELTRSRAVLVIWSNASIDSHFVEDEAERARAAGKLIPLQTKDLSVSRIPLGFGAYQTLLVDDLPAIKKAIQEKCRLALIREERAEIAAKLADTFYKRGKESYENRDYERAIEDLANAIRLDTSNAKAYFWRGNAYDAMSDPEHAIADYSKFIELEPSNPAGYAARAHAAQWWGEGDLGVSDLTTLIEMQPRNADAYRERGEVNYDRGDYGAAVADFSQVIKLEPGDDRAYCDRGRAYHKRGAYDLAIADYSRCIESGTFALTAYEERASVYRDKGELGKAERDLAEANALRSKRTKSSLGGSHVAPEANTNRPPKAPSEMSDEELDEEIRRTRGKLAKLERSKD